MMIIGLSFCSIVPRLRRFVYPARGDMWDAMLSTAVVGAVVGALLAGALAQRQAEEEHLVYGPTGGQVVAAKVGPTWYMVEFDKNWGSQAPATLSLVNSQPVIMRVSDMRCPGDRFVIRDFGVKIGTSRQREALPAHLFPPCCGSDEDDEEDLKTHGRPHADLLDSRNFWSTFKTTLPAGNHSITLEIERMRSRTAVVSVNFQLD